MIKKFISCIIACCLSSPSISDAYNFERDSFDFSLYSNPVIQKRGCKYTRYGGRHDRDWACTKRFYFNAIESNYFIKVYNPLSSSGLLLSPQNIYEKVFHKGARDSWLSTHLILSKGHTWPINSNLLSSKLSNESSWSQNQSKITAYYADFNADDYGDVLLTSPAFPQNPVILLGTANEPLPKAIILDDFVKQRGLDLVNAKVFIQDRNKDGRDDLIIKKAGSPDIIAFAEPNGSFLKADVDTGIGKYQGPSQFRSQFCNRSLLTKHPENPSSVQYDDICKTAYVTPPQSGSTQLEELIPIDNSANICPVLTRTVQEKNTIIEQLSSLTRRYKDIVSSLDNELSLQSLVSAKSHAYKALQVAIKTEYKANLDLLAAKRLYAEYHYQWESCKSISGNCVNEQTLLNKQKSIVKELTLTLDQSVKHRQEMQFVYDQAVINYENQLILLVELDQQLNHLLSEYYVLAEKELAVFKEYSQLDGATAKIRYSLDWDKQLQKYKDLNNSLGVSFKATPLTDVKIIASLPKQRQETPIGDHDISLPNVLYTAIDKDNLLGYEPSLMPSGEGVLNQTIKRSPSSSVKVPDHINATIGLSMSGYCLSYAPNSPYPQNLQSLGAHVAPSLQYEFEEEVKRSYIAKYNLYKYIQTIVKTKKKKRWFKKKKKTYIIRKVITKDWFNISFDSNRPEYSFTLAEQDAITQQVKANLIHRANNMIGVMYGTPSSSCNLKLSEDCLAGYWLGQQDGPDGDSKAIAHFKAGNNQWVSEKVFGIRYLTQSKWMSFK
ncbi:hypothetical protein [Zooshikella harenae]|uniref:VCBS repeat-containing protein n=1 Tax=Zooshikella harenae TaxID=2827238 RepID=A0ABS5ZK01_9GAMM|nr:hypothetical protein [Zooshikella harenae]MBU2713322.1 hypothetical protein [Zooshikella harenae]